MSSPQISRIASVDGSVPGPSTHPEHALNVSQASPRPRPPGTEVGMPQAEVHEAPIITPPMVNHATTPENIHPPSPDQTPQRTRRRPNLRMRSRAAIVPVVPQNQAPAPQAQQQNEGVQVPPQNNNGPPGPEVILAPPAPVPVVEPVQMDDPFNTSEWRMLKDVLNYLVISVARSSIYLMIIAWLVLYLPNVLRAQRETKSFLVYVASNTVLGLLIGGLGLKAIFDVMTRADIRVAGPFHAFEIRITQLMTASTLCVVLDTVMNPLGYGLGILYFNTQDAQQFYSQVEGLRKISIKDYLRNPSLWFHVNLHFLIVSFTILFALDILCMFYRMTKRNAAMLEIFTYELHAYLYPVGYIVSTLFILNCVAAIVPMAYQSFWYLWVPLNLLALAWIAVIFLGVMYYPEIPLRRPMGLPGYMYMEQVNLSQIGIGGCIHGFILLTRAIYFQLLPGSRIESLMAPGFVTGSYEYFSQLLGKKAQGSGEPSNYPYPFTYELIQGIYFLVFLIRYIKLRMAFESIQDRIDMDIHNRNNWD